MRKLRVQGSGFRVQGSVLFFVFLICFLYPVPCPLYPEAYAAPVSSVELIERAKDYDNQTVEFEGEVIGDIMTRGAFVWVNVNDGQSAIGVWAQRDDIQNIVNHKGHYKCKGDIIRVKGVFHRACGQHGGDLDIHMAKGQRVKNGSSILHQVRPARRKWAFGLAVVALGLAALAAIRSRKK